MAVGVSVGVGVRVGGTGVFVGGIGVFVGATTVTVLHTLGPTHATRGDASTSELGRHSAIPSYQERQHTLYVPVLVGVQLPLNEPEVPPILLPTMGVKLP